MEVNLKNIGLRDKITVMQLGGVIEFEAGEKNFISADVKITSEGTIMI